jgi:prophage antirepressor-like protein
MNRDQACQALFKSYCEAYPQKSKAQAQTMCNDKWNGLKKDSHLLSKVNNQIEEKKRLKTQTNANKRNENEKDIEVAK